MTGAGVGALLAGEDTDKAGPLGLLVLILIGIATYFLFRSMSRHLRRVREGFPIAPSPMPPARVSPAQATVTGGPADPSAPTEVAAPAPPTGSSAAPHSDHPSDA